MPIKNNFLRVVSCFFIIQFFILILLRFRGSYHSFYINAYNFFLDSSYFKNDMFLNNSILFDSTIYYKLLSLLGVKLETDLILFSIYLVLIFFNTPVTAFIFLGLIGISNGLANVLGSSTSVSYTHLTLPTKA